MDNRRQGLQAPIKSQRHRFVDASEESFEQVSEERAKEIERYQAEGARDAQHAEGARARDVVNFEEGEKRIEQFETNSSVRSSRRPKMAATCSELIRKLRIQPHQRDFTHPSSIRTSSPL